MRVLQKWSILSPILLGFGRSYPRDDQHQVPGLLVSTSSGAIQGKIDAETPNVRQFLGIPYAQPPLGDLRWAAPHKLPASSAKQTVNATQLPPSCLQYLGTSASVYTRNVLEFNLQGLNKTGSISEDCLTLGVWSPTLDRRRETSSDNQKLLPVIIFVYGGGFGTGGIDIPYQLPQQWVQRSGKHVVVVFNYRLSIFGFPNAAGITSGAKNFGLLDQRAAVEWVRDNIAAFGGDPKRMTLWGQSAGAESTDYYNFAYPSDPIVSGLIMDSGTAQTHSGPAPTTFTSFSYVASQVGCGNLTNNPAAELACMRNVSGTRIMSLIAQHSNSGASPGLSFSPITDNTTVFANYTSRALAGQQARLPAIIGTNANDGVDFTTYNPDGPNVTAALIAGLNTFFCDSTQTTRLRQLAGLPTFKYYYGGNFSNISPASWLGAYHSSELPMLMGTYGNFRGPSSRLEKATSEAMQDAYLAFAAGGGQALSAATGWQEYTALGRAQVRNFGNATAVGGGERMVVQDIGLGFLERLCNGSRANIH